MSEVKCCTKRIPKGKPVPKTVTGSVSVFSLAIFFLICHGGLLSNPTIDEWWRNGQMPPNVTNPTELTQLYDYAMKSFDIGDMIVGSVFMILKDYIGVAITTTICGIILTMSYSTYIIPYGGATVMKTLFIGATAMQGATLNGMSICFFHLASLPKLKIILKEMIAFMILNGSFDLSTLLAALFVTTGRSKTAAFWQTIALMISAIAMSLYGWFLLPRDSRIGVENDDSEDLHSSSLTTESRCTEENLDVKAIEASDTDIIKEYAKPPKPSSFLKELANPTLLVFFYIWSQFMFVKLIVNGSALTTAVCRVYGKNSFWMSFLKNFSWVGFVSGLLFGLLADYSFGIAFFIFVSICAPTSVWLLYFESRYTLPAGILLFFIFRGCIIGSLFYIIAKILRDVRYEGRVISVFCTVTGTIFMCIVGWIVGVTHYPERESPNDKDYRPVLKYLGVILIPATLVSVYWCFIQLPRRLKYLNKN